jgi:hypothetical protein
LAVKLGEELKYEKENTEKEPEFIKAFLSQNPFKVIIKFIFKSQNFDEFL